MHLIPCTPHAPHARTHAYTHNHTRTHGQVIPKVRDGLTQLSKAREDQKTLLGHMLYVAQSVAKQEGLDKGFRVVVNDGPDGCE
jgi:hypothetical protein